MASQEELGSLLDVLGEMNAGVVQLSGGGADARGRIAYAADLARRTGRPVLWQSISHSWSRPDFWQEMLVNTERVFREEGLPIYAMTQAKPFENRYTLLDAQCFDEFPTWRAAMFSPVPARREMFADPDVRRKLRQEAIEDQSPSTFPRRWDVIFIDKVKLPKNQSLERRTVQDVAESQGRDGLDVFFDLALEEDLETRFVHITTQGDPKAVCEILKHPSVMVGQSDAGAHMGYDARFGYCTAFLGRWVRDYGIYEARRGGFEVDLPCGFAVRTRRSRFGPARLRRRSGDLRSGDDQHYGAGIRAGSTRQRDPDDPTSDGSAPYGGERRSRHRERRGNGSIPGAGAAAETMEGLEYKGSKVQSMS